MLGLPLYLRGTTYYLHTRIAGKQVKRSLDTGHRRVAILRAIALLNDLHMSQRSTPPSKYEIDIARGIFKANGAEDHKQMLEALAALTNAKVPIAQTVPTPVAAPPQEDDASALRLGELLEKYLLFKQLTPATVRGYRLTVEELATFLGNPRITRVTRSDLVRFQEHLRTKGNGLRTVGKKLSTIITLFDFAKDHTYTRHDNPATGVDPLRWTGTGLILKPFRVLSRHARRHLRQHQTGPRCSFQSSGVRGTPGRCGGAGGCTSLQSR